MRYLAVLAALVSQLLCTALPAWADKGKEQRVVIYEPDCEGLKCRRTFRVALVDRISSVFTNSKRYKPIDRANLRKVMAEQLKCKKDIERGLSSKDCRIEAGRIAQARKMVLCRLVKMSGRDYQVTVSLTDLRTMKTERGVSESCWSCSMRQLTATVDRAARKVLGSGGGDVRGAPLDEGPGPAASGPMVSGGEVTAAVARLIVQVKPRTARVKVTGPGGFSATGGRSWERADLKPGTYKVLAGAKGYVNSKREVTLGVDDLQTVKMELQRPGALVVKGKPPGSKVEVTGPGGFKAVKGLPFSMKGAVAGTYRVRVSRPGYKVEEREVKVRPGVTTRLKVVLRKLTSSMFPLLSMIQHIHAQLKGGEFYAELTSAKRRPEAMKSFRREVEACHSMIGRIGNDANDLFNKIHTNSISSEDAKRTSNELKERLFRSKARINLLRETVLHGVIAGARLSIEQINSLKSKTQLTKVTYDLNNKNLLDSVNTNLRLNDLKKIYILDGSILPGKYTLDVKYEYFSMKNRRLRKGNATRSFSINAGQSMKIKAELYNEGERVMSNVEIAVYTIGSTMHSR